jgi:17beta-estradiol 17-dehydrogenase / very-long-chain 3-oxoacyl-CoA reductase
MDLKTYFSYVGAATLLTLGYRLVRHVYTYALRPSSLQRYRPQQPGSVNNEDLSWALITGASDGIGRGFAEELCSRGFNVILHGRNATKLASVKAALNSEFPASKVMIVTFDVTSSPGVTAASIDKFINSQLKNLRINILINNVGGMSLNFLGGRPLYRPLQDYSFDAVESVIDINVRFMVHLTRALLPTLEHDAPSLVINVSSAAAAGLACLIPYSGSKGFVESFTRGLKCEMTLLGADVDVMGIVVGNVQSGGNAIERNFFTPSSRAMAKAALDRVGCGKAIITAYWPHRLQTLSFDILPENTMRGFLNDTMRDLRKSEAANQKQE